MKNKKRELLVRMNSRVSVEQQKFIKAKAKADDVSEGVVLREMITFFMNK